MTKIYQLPHPLDRPYQADVLEWILESDKKYLILCAPTGFGKSPLPAAMSIDFRTLVLVLHKSLQSTNYRDSYNFDILYGKSNYPCGRPPEEGEVVIPGLDKVRYTAYDCQHHQKKYTCQYHSQRERCLASNRVSLNYAKFLSTEKFARLHQPKFLFLDEAHSLPDIVTEFVGITLNYNNEFLQCNGSSNLKPDTGYVMNYNEAMSTFRHLARACETNKPEQSDDLMQWRKWKRLSTKIQATNDILSDSDLRDWYYETTTERLLIKPLTAKYHFKRFFNVADKIVLMSATIKPNIAERLGIDKDEYDYMEVPSVWPAPTRLVYDLDAPMMNWKNRQKPEIKDEQVRLIANVLSPDKSGIIHTMSKAQAHELSKMLYNITPDWSLYFYVPTIGLGTEEQLEEWYQIRRPGAYCISWSFHEGVDLGNEDINIMAKVPYASLGSNYEKAKKNYDVAWYLERTAYSMEQMFGRHQRGIADHYTGDKLAFIADGSWHGLKSRLSSDFLQRVRNWNGK